MSHQGPQTQISRSGHSLTLNIYKMATDTAMLLIIIIISGFGIYGAAVVPDSGVGNTWQRLTLVLRKANRKLYPSFQMVPLSMTLSDPHFKVTIIFNVK